MPKAPSLRVGLLDVGSRPFGDAILIQAGTRAVLFDGAHSEQHADDGDHPSLPTQIGQLLGKKRHPLKVALLVVTHPHTDHVGCLPKLVEDGVLAADWALLIDPDIGFSGSVDLMTDAVDVRARQVALALREESLTRASDAQLAALFADAVVLEDRYRQMIETLEENGTRVIRYGRDDPGPLLRAFRRMGLAILGPSEELLQGAADIVAASLDGAVAAAADLLGQDRTRDASDVYRRLVVGERDEIDASRSGLGVNLMSLVTRLSVGKRRVLLTGDMHLADERLPLSVRDEVSSLREAISEGAPYDFYKLAHHGSHNGFGQETLDELGTTKIFGICTGEDSTDHPHPEVLEALDEEQERVKWLRTDRNGLSTVTFSGKRIEIRPGKPPVNDPRTNSDLGRAVAPLAPIAPAPAPSTSVTYGVGTAGQVEVITRLPAAALRVTVSITVEPQGLVPTGSPAMEAVSTGPLVIGSGRPLPRLLYVTSRQQLSSNIGRDEAERALAAATASGVLIDQIEPGTRESAPALALVHAALQRNPEVKGVVLLGGYDVVPAQRLDVLPARLRSAVRGNGDPDDFIVWSDDAYGDPDEDREPELPVTRIPDGRSSELFRKALVARAQTNDERSGIRNIRRPFAEPVFSALKGRAALGVSAPVIWGQRHPLEGERIYLMLHGALEDATRFWGEDTPGGSEALNVGILPDRVNGTVLAGCCWGALVATPPANEFDPNSVVTPRPPEASLALSFLARGALAFVGCTGAHYSPTVAPYEYFGGPLHKAFWQAHSAGRPPAEALLEAKRAFRAGMPHGQATALREAIEYKTLHQFTCLGLGW